MKKVNLEKDFPSLLEAQIIPAFTPKKPVEKVKLIDT